MLPHDRAKTPTASFGEAWKSAWVRLVVERRSFAGRASVIGVRTGLIAGGVLPMSVFAGNEFLGNGSSTSVLALLAMPVLVPMYAVAGGGSVGVITWCGARVVSVFARNPTEWDPRRAFGWSRWLGVTLAIVATVVILTYDL